MKPTRADIENGLHMMAQDPRMKSCLPDAHQLECFIAKLEENRPGIIQWKKYNWIATLLSNQKLSEADAARAADGGYLGKWSNRAFNAPLDEEEFDFMLDGLYETLDQLELASSEGDPDSVYNLRRGLRMAFTHVAVPQLERELGVRARADNPTLKQ